MWLNCKSGRPDGSPPSDSPRLEVQAAPTNVLIRKVTVMREESFVLSAADRFRKFLGLIREILWETKIERNLFWKEFLLVGGQPSVYGHK